MYSPRRPDGRFRRRRRSFRQENHFAEGPDDDGGENLRGARDEGEGAEADGVQKSAERESAAMRPARHSSIERNFECDDEQGVQRKHGSVKRFGQAQIADEEEGKRRGELKENELRGNHRREEVEHAGIAEGAQIPGGEGRRRAGPRNRLRSRGLVLRDLTSRGRGSVSVAQHPSGPSRLPLRRESKWRHPRKTASEMKSGRGRRLSPGQRSFPNSLPGG